MCVACLCVHMKLPIFLCCTFDTTLIILPSFMKIWHHLPEIWRFVFCPKWCARFYVLCMHARTCTCTNIINQFRRQILNYTEGFMKIWLHLADILRFVTTLKKCYLCEDLGKKRKNVSAAISEFFRTKNENGYWNQKVSFRQYLSGVRPPFFHFQSGRASKWPLKTFKMSKNWPKK